MSQNKIIGIDILLEFLEVAVHSILYFRKLYPAEVFTEKKIYGTSVYISQHPELNEYIKKILTSVRELILSNENDLKSINLFCLNENKEPIERFTFCLDKLKTSVSESDPYFIKIEEGLRTLYLKLSTLVTYLEPLPNNSSFTISIFTNRAAHINLSENTKCNDFPWIIDNSKEVNNGSLIPLKSFETDFLLLQCFALVNKKFKLF